MLFLRCVRHIIAWGALSLVLLSVQLAHAQPSADSVHSEALLDFHGPDLEGKDGPLSKAGLDLLILYHRHHRLPETCSFPSDSTHLPVSDDHVTIDAIATTDPNQLHNDLERLGLKNGTVADFIVSGRLPISQIPSMAKLESLQQARPAQRSTSPMPRLPSPPLPPVRDSTAPSPSDTSSHRSNPTNDSPRNSASSMTPRGFLNP